MAFKQFLFLPCRRRNTRQKQKKLKCLFVTGSANYDKQQK